MRYLIYLAGLFGFFFIISPINSQVYFQDDCEVAPSKKNYTEEYLFHSFKWDTLSGGHSTNPGIPLSGNPPAPYQGNLNYIFIAGSNNATTKLVTPAIDLRFAIKPQLRFFYAMADWAGGIDELRVFFKNNSSADWQLLETFTLVQEDWKLETLNLPDEDLSESCKIAFEGKYQFGHGVCIDSITLIETASRQSTVDSVKIIQVNEEVLPTRSQNNPIIQLQVFTSGNVGKNVLNEIKVRANNFNDEDISTNGVKLYRTNENIFREPVLLGSGQTIENQEVLFSGLNDTLKNGDNIFWITYDIDSIAKHLNQVDAWIEANEIVFDNNVYFPDSTENPAGFASIIESIQYSDFEKDEGWLLQPEFERAKPQGLGNILGYNADPTFAHGGEYVLGTDVTGQGVFQGDYEVGLDSAEYFAISPSFNAKYYRDLELRFYRWLNIENQDTATIDFSTDNGNTWKNIWINELARDNSWEEIVFDLSDELDRQENARIRFTLGPTDSIRQLSGWNIDDVAITGNKIERDLKLDAWIKPSTQCEFGSAEIVTVQVSNLAIEPAQPPILVCYSIDGDSVVYDTITTQIGVDESITFDFSVPVDLSEPAIYEDAFAAVLLEGDEDNRNDTLTTIIYSLPNLELPHANNFNKSISYWRVGGQNPSWEYGLPSGSRIINAATGIYSWVTNLNGGYNDHEMSYIESPCYNLSSADRPILELKYNFESEPGIDGLNIQYSVDDGQNWATIEKHPSYIFDWNWYENPVDALGNIGGSGFSAGWEYARVVLPDELIGASNVIFRVGFASDGDNNSFDGAAVDDIRLYEAPEDIGAVSIDNIVDACQNANPEYPVVSVQNHGIRPIKTGEEIVIGIDVNNEPTVTDTFTLVTDLAVAETRQFTFNKKISANNVGSNTLNAFTLGERFSKFYGGASNDTMPSPLTINISESPITDMPDTVASNQLDTLELTPFFKSSYSYLWNDGDTNKIKDTLFYGTYTLTVTDDGTGGNNCTTVDSVQVLASFSDLGLGKIIYPTNDCQFSNQTKIIVGIENTGTNTIFAGNKVIVGFEVDGGGIKIDTVTLAKDIEPNNFYPYEFAADPVDMSAIKTYDIMAFTDFPGDSISVNDTLTTSKVAWGFPTVEIGPDVLYHRGLFYAFSVGVETPAPGESYFWPDSTTETTYFAHETGTHWVKMTDKNGCVDYDSVYLELLIRDVAPVSINEPAGGCGVPNDTYLSASFVNMGTDTLLTGDTIPVKYDLNIKYYHGEEESKPTRYDTIFVQQDVLPGDTLSHLFKNKEKINVFGDYTFGVEMNYEDDLISNNDFIDSTVTFLRVPFVNIADSGIYQVKSLGLYLSGLIDTCDVIEWQDGSTADSFIVTSSGNYSVEVTDNCTGCTAMDASNILLLYIDLGISLIQIPSSDICVNEFNNVDVIVSNFGTVQLPITSDDVFVAYKVENAKPVYDTVPKSAGSISSGGAISHEIEDMQISGSGDFQIAFYTEYYQDVDPSNDTLYQDITLKKSPYLEWPEIDTVQMPYVLEATQSEPAIYQWFDGFTGNAYTANREGEYEVNITYISSGCSGTFSVVLIPGSGNTIEEQDLSADLFIYPNPASDLLNLRFGDEIPGDEVFIQLMNMEGKVLKLDSWKTGDNPEKKVNVADIEPGMYLVRIYNDDLSSTTRVVIE